MKGKLTVIAALWIGLLGLKAFTKEKNVIVVYSHSSLAKAMRKHNIFEHFEKRYSVSVQVKSLSDSAKLVARLIMEQENPLADIFMGVDRMFGEKLAQHHLIAAYSPPKLPKLSNNIDLSSSSYLIPLDYGYISLVYNANHLKVVPKSLDDLLHKRYKGRIILQDPRLSSPGMAFFKWVMVVKGQRHLDFWRQLKPNILTITNNWTTAYGLFTSGEAPLVLSYMTSPVYHIEKEKVSHIKSIGFAQGNYLQVEYLGLVKKKQVNGAAKKLIDFILGQHFQGIIPAACYMYPIRGDVSLPVSYQQLPHVEKSLQLDNNRWEREGKKALQGWLRVM